MYEIHLRDKYKGHTYKKRGWLFICCRLFCPFGAERDAKYEMQDLISVEQFYKMASSYDQLLQDVERLKALLNSKAPEKKDDDLEANCSNTNC